MNLMLLSILALLCANAVTIQAAAVSKEASVGDNELESSGNDNQVEMERWSKAALCGFLPFIDECQ